jgi:hypothetical protein
LNLTDDEKKMRDGQLGEAVCLAMSILVDLGAAIGAPEMVEIAHVHTDMAFSVFASRKILVFGAASTLISFHLETTKGGHEWKKF